MRELYAGAVLSTWLAATNFTPLLRHHRGLSVLPIFKLGVIMALIEVNNPPQQGVIYLSKGCNVALTFRLFDGDENPIDLSGGLEIEIDQGSADAVRIEADVSDNTASVLIPSEVSDTAKSGWQWRVKRKRKQGRIQ